MILRLSKDPEDADGLCHFWFFASTKEYSATVDFFAYADEFVHFGEQLAEYSGRAGHEPHFEYGSKAESSYSWLHVQAYPTDMLGHSAIAVSTMRNGARAARASAEFSGKLEVAAVNKLGKQLAAWAAADAREFEFEAYGC